MESKKQTTSSSSLAAELFGSKESSSASSSSGLFNSIFPPPSKPHGKDYITSEVTGKNHEFATKQDSVDKEDKINQSFKKDMSPFYQQERLQPCPLSSSIYYGGQDIYTNPQPTKTTTPGSNHWTQYNKDGEDDGHATRGNWWQGSLYY